MNSVFWLALRSPLPDGGGGGGRGRAYGLAPSPGEAWAGLPPGSGDGKLPSFFGFSPRNSVDTSANISPDPNPESVANANEMEMPKWY